MTTLQAIAAVLIVSAVIFLLGVLWMWLESIFTKAPKHHSTIYNQRLVDYWNEKKGN